MSFVRRAPQILRSTAALAQTSSVRPFSVSQSLSSSLSRPSALSPLLRNEPGIVSIIGAPMADGQPLEGVDQGPKFIRSGGLLERLQRDEWVVEDLGDLDFASFKKTPAMKDHPHAINSNLVGAANEQLYRATYEAAKNDNKFVLSLGGDHSIGIGSMSGILQARPETSIIWVDAHADINTPSGSASKNIHGMVLSFLMNLENCRNTINGFEWMHRNPIPILQPSRLVYIGLRDLDPPEKATVKQLGIKAFTMHDVDKYGIAKVMEMALDHVLGRLPRPLHLSLDIDSIDPMYAPSTGTRVAGGLNYREAYYICEASYNSSFLRSMDMVEVNPSVSPEGSTMTVNMAVGLVSSALGNKIL